MARDFFTLTHDHVGKPAISAWGRSWLVTDFMGRVLPLDVGKRVYNVGGVLQVENDEQFDKRRHAERVAHYERLAKEASESGFVLEGYGGVLTLVHPDVQREKGLEAQILYAAGLGPPPPDPRRSKGNA